MISDLDEARRRLSAGLDELSQCTAQFQRWAAVFEQGAQEAHEQAREELSEYARSADAPEELKRLQQQIDRGELSWYGAVIGEADDVIDRGAGQFLASTVAALPMLGDALRSGASAEEAAELAASAAQRRDEPSGANEQGSVTR